MILENGQENICPSYIISIGLWYQENSMGT